MVLLSLMHLALRMYLRPLITVCSGRCHTSWWLCTSLIRWTEINWTPLRWRNKLSCCTTTAYPIRKFFMQNCRYIWRLCRSTQWRLCTLCVFSAISDIIATIAPSRFAHVWCSCCWAWHSWSLTGSTTCGGCSFGSIFSASNVVSWKIKKDEL